MPRESVGPSKIMDAGDMSGNLNTSAADISYLDGYYFQAVWTGSPVGNFTVQASGDGGTTWETVPGTTKAAGGISDSFLWNVDAAFYPDVRLSYASTSGTGSVDVHFGGKGV